MKCGQAEKWMDAVLDEAAGIRGCVSPARRTALDSHLAECSSCRRQWEALQTAEAVLRVPRPIAVPDGLLAEFRLRLEAEAPAPVRQPAVRGLRAWLWPAGSLALAGAAAAFVMSFGVRAPLTPVRTSSEHLRTPLADTAPSSPEPDRFGVRDDALATHPRTLRRNPDVANRAVAPNPEQRPPLDLLSASTPKPSSADASVASRNDRAVLGYAQHESLTTLSSQTRALRDLETQRFGRSRPSIDSFYKRDTPTPKMLAAVEVARNPINPDQDLALRQMVPNTDWAAPEAMYRKQSVTVLASVSGYVQVPVEPLPPELNVSAALLTALQRDVVVDLADTSLREVVEQLGESADVELKVDMKAGLTNVTVQESGAPLWRVLEDVARQSGLEIYPRENTLVLRRLSATPAAELAEMRKSKAAEDKLRPSASTAKRADLSPLSRHIKPNIPREAVPPTGPAVAATLGVGVRPDRLVWTAAWGNLPERGFAVPSATELPALVLAREATPEQELPKVRERTAAPSGGGAPDATPKSPGTK